MSEVRTDLAHAAWRLLPGNPIVTRVVSIGSKRLPHLWTRIAYLVVLFLVVLIMSSTTGGSDALNERAKSATRVFEYVSILQLAMMCLLAPVFTAGAISQEKDAETFNVLLTTPLTNAQIVLGSLCSRLFFVIALLVSGLPIFCITMLFGGVTANQIFLSFGIAACTAIMTGSIAILISVMRIGTRGTIFSFYMGIALFLLVGLGLGRLSWTYVPETVVPGSTEAPLSFIAPFHPYLALEVALGKVRAVEPGSAAHYGWPLRYMVAEPHKAYMLLTGLASVFMAGVATFFVRRGVKQGEVSLLRRMLQWTKRSADTRRARRVWSNPVAWREATTRASAGSSDAVRYGYLIGGIIAAVLLFWYYLGGHFKPGNPVANAREAADWLTMIVLVEFVSVMLMAANTAATGISRERESDTMELLLTTPLTSKYIVWGKLRGLVSFTLPLLALPALTVLVAAAMEAVRAHTIAINQARPIAYVGSALALPPLLVIYSSFACMLGLQMSLKSKRSVQAVLATVGILIVIGFGLGMCAFGLANGSVELAAIVSPFTFVTAIWMVLNPSELTAMNRNASIDVDQIQVFMLVGTVVSVAVYGAIVAGMYRSMVRNFDMIVRKQSR